MTCGSGSGAIILCTIYPRGELWLVEEWPIITLPTNHNLSRRRVVYKIVHKIMALEFSFSWINPTDPANQWTGPFLFIFYFLFLKSI